VRDRFLRLLLATLHRVRQHGPSLLGLLAVGTLALGTIGFIGEGHATRAPCRWDEALYYTAGLFTFAGNRFGYPSGLLLRVVYFAAPTVSALSLVGALFHLVEEKAPVLLGRFRGHVVVGGLGKLGATLSRHQRAHGHPVIAIEKDERSLEVANLRASGEGLVVQGDMTQSELLLRARAHFASRVFFASPSDVANLDASFQLRRLARTMGSGRPPTIYAHVYDTDLAESLRPQLDAGRADDAPIVVFNSYRFAAKALLALLLRDRRLRSLRVSPGLVLARTSWPAVGMTWPEPGGPREAILAEDQARLKAAFRLQPEGFEPAEQRLVLVGLGRFGRAVLRELLDAAPASAHFMVVERDPAVVVASEGSFPEAERSRLQFAVGDAVSAGVRAAIQVYQPSAVLVCTDNDIINVRLALDLRRLGLEVVTRMFDLESSIELGRALQEHGISPIGLSALVRAAVPILTHEQFLLACLNLDFNHTPQESDHLFYLARVSAEERARVGAACLPLAELPAAPGTPAPPPDLALVWSQDVRQLGLDTLDD
jgi:Trk K+ transport system NAD-binding subunit